MSSPPVSRRLVFVMYSGIYFLNKNISIFGPPFSRSLVFVMYSFGLRWMSFLSKLEGNGHFSPVFFIFGLPLTALRFQDLKSWKNFSIFSGVTIYIYHTCVCACYTHDHQLCTCTDRAVAAVAVAMLSSGVCCSHACLLLLLFLSVLLRSHYHCCRRQCSSFGLRWSCRCS